MKRILSIIALIIYLLSFQTPIYAANSAKDGTVEDSYKIEDNASTKADQKESSSETSSSSNIITVFLLFIKVAFYILIISALLVLVMRFLAKRNRLLASNGPILSLGGQPLGNNKSIQMVLIGQTIYVLGVGDTVTLLRTISQGDEYMYLLENFDNQNQENELTQKWAEFDLKKIWATIFRKDKALNQQDLNSFDSREVLNRFSQNDNPLNSKNNWDSVFRKHLNKMQANEEE